MRCPGCQADLPANAETCPTCKKAVPRRKSGRKRNLTEDESPFGPCSNPSNWPAVRAYRISLCALLPVVGAFLGPVAFVLGLRALKRADPNFTAEGAARAAIVLGGAVTVTNWAGLTLVVLGLR